MNKVKNVQVSDTTEGEQRIKAEIKIKYNIIKSPIGDLGIT